MNAPQYRLIKRGLYYRPEAKGYTSEIAEAGLFTREFASKSVQSTHGEVSMHLVEPSPIPDSEIEVARASLWAAHCSLALHSLRVKVLEFGGGVRPFNPTKHGEPKVTGFMAEWEALVAEVSKAEPVVMSTEAARKMLEDAKKG